MYDLSRHCRLVGFLVLLFGFAVVGCRASDERDPSVVVRAFIEELATFDGDDEHAERLFQMLSTRAQKTLKERAARYSAASGRTIAPAAMLVPGRFSPGPIRSYSSKTEGKHALVHVLGASAQQQAQIPCVYESGAWRIDIVIPALPPLERRPSESSR